MHGIIENLINELTRLPGIGRKSAQRLAFFILSMPDAEALSLAEAIQKVKEKARFCSQCFNITEKEIAKSAAMIHGTGAGWSLSRNPAIFWS